MDIRVYFQKIREIERNIQEPYVVVISLETPEGGKPGQDDRGQPRISRPANRGRKGSPGGSERAAAFYKKVQRSSDCR